MSPARWFGAREKRPMPQQQARVLFNKTLSSYGRQGSGEYNKVNSLFITWKDDDLGCVKSEVRAIRKGRFRRIHSLTSTACDRFQGCKGSSLIGSTFRHRATGYPLEEAKLVYNSKLPNLSPNMAVQITWRSYIMAAMAGSTKKQRS
jgi:hypothetical protein